jgi:hypothetical protein
MPLISRTAFWWSSLSFRIARSAGIIVVCTEGGIGAGSCQPDSLAFSATRTSFRCHVRPFTLRVNSARWPSG